jgi:uncharacterized repeat protein (TIGR02543 family)
VQAIFSIVIGLTWHSKALASMVVFVLALAMSLAAPLRAFASDPTAGTCSEASGSWVCNVEGQTLSFDTVGSVTQDGTAGNQSGDDIFNPNAGETITYKNVFSHGSTTIDASLAVISKTNINYIDRDGSNAFWDQKAIEVSAGGSSSTEFTVSFFERSSGQAVTMLNVSVVVKDLDGTQNNTGGSTQVAREFAIFQGLSSYITTNPTDLRVSTVTSAPAYDGNGTVPGLESPSPETGLRQFYSEATKGDGIYEQNMVAVKFDAVTAVGFLAGARGAGGGIVFQFGPPSFTVSTAEVTVSDGTYTIDYNADGGSGTVPTSVSASGSVTLSDGGNLSKAGVDITGWSTASGGGGSKYPLSSPFTPVKDVTLFAVYATITVTFDANGGSGTMASQQNSGPTALNANTFERDNYTFSGWNTASDGSGASFANRATFPFLVDDTLYAQWSLAPAEAGSVNTGIFLYLAGRPGSPAEGCPVYYGSVSIKPNTTYILSIQSVTNPALTRTVLATGTTNDWGHADKRLEMGKLAPGTYKVVMTGTHRLDYPLVLTNYISVDRSGNFISLSPESLQPTLS